MTQVKDIKFEGTGSHSVKFGRGYAVGEEEVFLYFSATWLNKPVRFTQRASRYTASSGITGWRNYVVDANYVVEVEGANGTVKTVRDGSLSDKARRALDVATDHMVKGWLTFEVKGFENSYPASYARAVGNAIQRLGDDRYESWKSVIGAVDAHQDVLSAEVKESLLDWAKLLLEVAQGREKVTRALEANEWFNSYYWKKFSREEVSS